MKKAFFIFILFFVCSSVSYAQSIGISPSSLEFGEGREKTLNIFNPNNRTISFVVENNDPDNIGLSEDSGEIPPNGKKSIIVSIKDDKKVDSTLNIAIENDEGKDLSIMMGAEVDVHAENRKVSILRRPWVWIIIIGLMMTMTVIIIR